MSKNKLEKELEAFKNFQLPSNFQENLNKSTESTIKAVAEGMQQLAKEFEDFDKRFEERQKQIDKGARKTNGLVV